MDKRRLIGYCGPGLVAGLVGACNIVGRAPDPAQGTPDARQGRSDAGQCEPDVMLPVSCKEVLQVNRSAPSGSYTLFDSLGQTTYKTYCDMTTEGGGWTRITNALGEAIVERLRGASGREMIKCNDAGREYIMSPSFSGNWSWASSKFNQLAGTWTVNGSPQNCGSDQEYTDVACAQWWGYGCGNGPGLTNKFFPGVIDAPPGTCVDSTSGHTNSAFIICGDVNYRRYSVFIRAE